MVGFLTHERHELPFLRSNMLELADISTFDARGLDQATLIELIFHHVTRTGRLIVVREDLHLPPCGVGRWVHLEDRKDAIAGQWGGDTARWTQAKKLLSLHPDLRLGVTAVIAALAKSGFEPKIFFGWRSVAVQLEIFKLGHTKVKFSFHNAQKKDGTPNAYAADIIDKRWAWTAAAKTEGFWSALGAEAKNQGLFWGGDWKAFPDWAHVQLVANSQLGRVKKESGL